MPVAAQDMELWAYSIQERWSLHAEGLRAATQRSAGVNLPIRSRALGQDRPHPRVRRIDLHDELPGGVSLDENGGRQEKPFKTREGSLHLRRPGKWEGRRGETSERGCNPAVITEEPPVEIGKPQELLQFLVGIGNGPVCHCTDLLGTGPHLPPLNDEPKEAEVTLNSHFSAFTYHLFSNSR
jgi:hypothetical protein